MNEIRGPETWDTPLGPSSDSMEIVNELTRQSINYSDREKFRMETAAKMLTKTCEWHIKKGSYHSSIPKEAACKLAIEYADELIKQLEGR